MKKLITVVIALIMVLSLGALVGCNDDKNGSSTQITGIEYELVKKTEGNYYVVEKFNVSDDDARKINANDYDDIMIDLVIPETYNSLPVKEISQEAFINQKLIKSVVVPSSIIAIGAGAFAGCVNLEKITLPFIGEKVGAVNEKKVFGYIFGTTSGDGLTEAKQRYNANTETTKSYYIPTKLTEVNFVGVEGNYNLPEYAFNACNQLKTITLNSQTTVIPRSAFADCIAIKSFDLTANVKSIDAYAFSGCQGLLKVKFNSLIESIGENAFEGCTKLNSEVNLVIPASVTNLGMRAFKECTALVGVDVSAATSLTIKPYTFDGCTLLKNVVLNGQYVEDFAFSSCTALKQSGVTGFNASNCGEYAFPFLYIND